MAPLEVATQSVSRGKRRPPGAWAAILKRAAEIVKSYDTGVTLRQLFYRLVSEGLLANTQAEYGQLSKRTAEARRKGRFPPLIDRTRTIHRYPFWNSPEAALAELASCYRRDRTEGQPFTVYLGVEKAGLVELLLHWFGSYGVPILALGGYSSQTYADEINEDIKAQNRPAVLIYAGDFDPSGVDIERDFVKRVNFYEVRRVALTWDQVLEYNLPPQPGKSSDSRAKRFVEKHGRLVQVELDALPPDVLRSLFEDALTAFFDMSTWKTVVQIEAWERRWLGALWEKGCHRGGGNGEGR